MPRVFYPSDTILLRRLASTIAIKPDIFLSYKMSASVNQ